MRCLCIVMAFLGVNVQMLLVGTSYQVIKPATPSQREEMRAALERTRDFAPQQNDGYLQMTMEMLLERSDPEKDWYSVDVNNDGTVEYVYTIYADYHNIEIYVTCPNNNGILTLLNSEEIDFDVMLPGGYNVAFVNALTDCTELLVAVKGKVYLCLGTSEKYQRSIYEWDRERGGFAWCRIAFWIQQQRAHFQELYDRKQYWKAYEFLHEFERRVCRGSIDTQIDLWIRCDLALAALRSGYPQRALAILDAMRDEVAAVASSQLRKAVAHNRAQAQQALERDRKGERTYDFSWLLIYEGCKISDINRDARSESMLAATMADVQGPRGDRHSYTSARNEGPVASTTARCGLCYQ